MGVCHKACDPPCSYGCELRQKNVGVAPSAMPTRMNKVPPPKANPVWEKQIITDKRCDGSEMPIFERGTNQPLHVKQYTEDRRYYDEGLKRVKSDEPIFT